MKNDILNSSKSFLPSGESFQFIFAVDVSAIMI